MPFSLSSPDVRSDGRAMAAVTEGDQAVMTSGCVRASDVVERMW
ncbi:Uncharacterised protein [Amycolatopsis camponoti]|uniref:Uncharacterized protein n=1 Tax=Amycolatopsis camponoti TaxID=2606593 RepID=A0A6I8LDV6_9PSEU|nr:Uncharacterised protein [Amycolatopsis camponoti]